VEIIFGNGKLSELAKLTQKSKHILLVSDPFFQQNGLVDKIKSILGNILVFDEISPNPDVKEVNRCSALIREKQIDTILALGGGSSMDLAKAASIRAERMEDYHDGKKVVPADHIPVIAIPTTSGTGSEVTSVAVLTNRKTGKKAPVVSDSFYPKVALIDPEITLSLPPYMTASTGIDVLCHAVEGYWSRGHQPICDALAIHAIKLVLQNLVNACHNGKDKEAREKLSEASVIAGLAFSLPKTTACHACSFPLTNIYHIPHGEACGLTLDYFIKINAGDKRTQELVHCLGYETVNDFANTVKDLKKELHLRINLEEFSLSEDEIQELVQLSHHPNLNNNPVSVTDEILSDLYYELGGKKK